jgi:hypothetical protein
MAMQFVIASTEYLNWDNLPVSGYPFTMACWFKYTTLTAGVLISFADSSVPDNLLELGVDNLGHTRTNRQNLGSLEQALSTTTVSTDVWAHALGVFTSSTSCDVYLNGGGVGSNTNSISYGIGANQRTRIANSASSSAAGFNGSIAIPAVWNVVLDAGEIAALAKGFDPMQIRPSALRFLLRGRRVDLVGTTQRDCWKNRFDFTEVNTPTYVDDPPLILAA